MENNIYYVNLIELLRKYSEEQRRNLIIGYVNDTFDDDAITKMPAVFFAELLKDEKDVICKWYEIKAIGELRAIEYTDLLIAVLFDEDFRFETGSSLHLITARSLGLIGETIIPKLMDVFDDANDSTRLAIIDTLGETRCEFAAETLEKLLPKLEIKEFTYAVLALAKCGAKGQEVLRKTHSSCLDNDKLCSIIDALFYSAENDNFIKKILYENDDVMAKVLLSQTRGACILLERITKVNEPWTIEDKKFIIQKGVII